MALQLSGESISTERTGAATATVSFHEKDGIPDVPGSHRGLRLVKRETRQQEDGSFVTVATYEGRSEDVQIGGGGEGATYAARENAVYEWSPSFEQTDIAKHPNIGGLLFKYKGIVDEATGAVIWPKTLAGDAAGEGLYEGDEGGTNPMFGVTSFLSLGGVWSETVFESNLPDDVFNDGYVDNGVPGAPNPENRFWLRLPAIIVSHGDGYKVTRRWMLSGFASARDIIGAMDIYG